MRTETKTAVFNELKTPLGKFHAAAITDDAAEKLCALFFPSYGPGEVERRLAACFSRVKRQPLPILRAAHTQLLQYLSGKRRAFELPYVLFCTDFERRVYSELLKIPYGQTASYGEIAARCGSPKAARAVGSACRKNPLPLIIPCHRVIGSHGGLTGFGGGIDMKKALLELEKRP